MYHTFILNRLFSRDDEVEFLRVKAQNPSSTEETGSTEGGGENRMLTTDNNILRVTIPSASKLANKNKNLNRIFVSPEQSMLSVIVDDRVDMWWHNDDARSLVRVLDTLLLIFVSATYLLGTIRIVIL